MSNIKLKLKVIKAVISGRAVMYNMEVNAVDTQNIIVESKDTEPALLASCRFLGDFHIGGSGVILRKVTYPRNEICYE
jgi:hypothetical protein